MLSTCAREKKRKNAVRVHACTHQSYPFKQKRRSRRPSTCVRECCDRVAVDVRAREEKKKRGALALEQCVRSGRPLDRKGTNRQSVAIEMLSTCAREKNRKIAARTHLLPVIALRHCSDWMNRQKHRAPSSSSCSS